MNVNPNHSSSSQSHFFLPPLIKFHGKVISTLDHLPNEGKVLEIVKRVLIVVISPFVYLSLGLLTATELALRSINKLIKNSFSEISLPLNLNLNHSLSISWDRISQQIIFTINRLKEKGIHHIHSAKILIDIECTHKKFRKDLIIKKLDVSCFDCNFLSKEAVSKILDDAKDFFGMHMTNQIHSKLIVLIKDKEGIFHEAHNSVAMCGDNQGGVRESSSFGECTIGDPKKVKLFECIKHILTRMGREVQPQVNDALEFI